MIFFFVFGFKEFEYDTSMCSIFDIHPGWISGFVSVTYFGKFLVTQVPYLSNLPANLSSNLSVTYLRFQLPLFYTV